MILNEDVELIPDFVRPETSLGERVRGPLWSLGEKWRGWKLCGKEGIVHQFPIACILCFFALKRSVSHDDSILVLGMAETGDFPKYEG